MAQLLETDAFAGCLKSIYILGVRTPPGRVRPLLGASSQSGLHFGIGFYSMVPASNSAAMDAVRRANDYCLHSCVALGGRPYLYGAHRLDRGLMDRAFGSELEGLRDLRRELDPLDLFQPGTLP